MPAFEFQALDPAGREQRGVLEADSPRQVRQLLRDRQWLSVSVLEVGERRATAAYIVFIAAKALPTAMTMAMKMPRN